MSKPIIENVDLCYMDIRGMRNFKRKPQKGQRKYKLECIAFEGGHYKEYCIVGPDGVWADCHTNPRGAIQEALAVIPGITLNDIDFYTYRKEVGRIER